MDTSLAPASPVKSVCTRRGEEQTGQTHRCWPFLLSLCSGTGLGWLLPHWQSQVLALALLTRGPATQQLPHQPLPACHTLFHGARLW